MIHMRLNSFPSRSCQFVVDYISLGSFTRIYTILPLSGAYTKLLVVSTRKILVYIGSFYVSGDFHRLSRKTRKNVIILGN
jgi:hypothetical protein